MNKSVLKWMAKSVAVVAIGAVTATTVFAQSVDQEFARELKLIEALKVYNQQKQEQIKAQGVARNEIQRSIQGSQGLGQEIGGMLKPMVDALDRFVKADLPFHRDDRVTSVNNLKNLLQGSGASNSAIFRNIMDIYTIELEYGNSYEAYKATQDVNGNQVEVDMLRIGRVALYFQTTDQSYSAMWDTINRTWKELPDSANRDIRTAIKVAAKSTAPELLNLPLTAPEGV